jgi:1-acyl-sn-glycerol-3-phosphate acyltransferase
MKEILKCIAIAVFGVFFRVKLINRHNIPEKGAAVLCSNHVGELDMFFIGYRIKRLVHWMAKEELFKNSIISFILRRLGAFPVKRGKGDIESIKIALKLLKDGHILGIFPEGTRTKRKDIKLIKAKPGVAMFALKSGAPIIPVAIEGKVKMFGKIRVIFGEPFYLASEKDKKYTNVELAEMSQNIMLRVYSLMEE